MSGYGVPQDPQPGTRRSRRSGPVLPVLELVGLGLAVLAFVIAFLPWARPQSDAIDVTLQGWDLPLPTVATVVLLVAALLVVAPLLTGAPADADGEGADQARAHSAPAAHAAPSADGTASPLPALLAALAAVLYLVHALSSREVLGSDFERGIGVWLGLLLGLGTAATLVLSWLQRSGRIRRRAPAGADGHWGGQQPGYGQPPGYGQQAPAGYPGGAHSAHGVPGGQPYGHQPPSGYGQQPGYRPPVGPPTGGQPAQDRPYGQEQYPPTGGQPAQDRPYGQEQYPPTGGQPARDRPYGQEQYPPTGYPSQGQGYPRG